VNERGWLQRLASRFVRHPHGGEPAQFFIDQRQKFLRRFGITRLRGL
jgi:hypothetical protein